VLENAAHGESRRDGVPSCKGVGDNGPGRVDTENRFTRIPLSDSLSALDPFAGSHQPRATPRGRSIPVLRPKPSYYRSKKAIDAQAHSAVVEKDVARILGCFYASHTP